MPYVSERRKQYKKQQNTDSKGYVSERRKAILGTAEAKPVEQSAQIEQPRELKPNLAMLNRVTQQDKETLGRLETPELTGFDKFKADHPLFSKIADFTTKASQFNDVTGAYMRKGAFGDNTYFEDPNTVKTTGSKVGDTAAQVIGTLEGFALPSGGGAPTMFSGVRQIGDKWVNAITPFIKGGAVSPLIKKVVGKGLAESLPETVSAGIKSPLAQKAILAGQRGIAESLPVTAQQAFVNKDTPEELAKNALFNAGTGMAAEIGLMGLGEAGKALFKKAKPKVEMPKAESPSRELLTGDYVKPFKVPDEPQIKNFTEPERKFYQTFKKNDIPLNDETIDQFTKEYKAFADDIKKQQLDYLYGNKTKGVQQGGLIKDAEGNVVGRVGRVSKNEKWYRDFWVEKGRAPSRKEIFELADKQLKEGFATNDGVVPPNEMYIEAVNNIDSLNSLKGKLPSKSEAKYVETPRLKSTIDTAETASTMEKSIDSGIESTNVKLPKKAKAAVEPGSNPFKAVGREPDIPKGMEESGVSKNIRTDANRPDELRDSYSADPLVHKKLGNKDTLAKAQKIFDEGLEPAVTKLNDLIEKMQPEAAPLVKMIADKLTLEGNIVRARELISNAATKATEAGQFGQAFRILRDADPETFLMTIDKSLKKLNEQGSKLYGKKWKNVDLTADELKGIQGLQRGNEQAYNDLMDTIGSRIAKELPSSGMEKFDAWRRMAMLLNPKTHLKNFGGNIPMMALRKASDTIGAGIEAAVNGSRKVIGKSPLERSKSVGWSLDKDIVSKVDETWEANKKELLGESRWEIDNLKVLGQEKQIFKKGLVTKGAEKLTGKTFEKGALEWLNKFSKDVLNLEDAPFLKRAYRDALGQYMKANKLKDVTDSAMKYAKRRALEATYKQPNAVSNFLSKVKSNGGISGKLTEAAIPFSKTPTNIVARSIEYSPAGLAKLLFSKGKPASEIIETLSKGLTGSAVVGLGFLLADMGWVRSEKTNSKRAEALLDESGEQPYSLMTAAGSYTMDWLQPLASTFFMGVAAYESLQKKDNIDMEAAVDAVSQGGDTIFNLSMLQGVKKFLGGSYGSATEQILGLPVSYVEQGYPAILGQSARSIDGTKRSTYDPNMLKQFGNNLKAKTPFLSSSLEPKLDLWGNEQEQGGFLQQFFSPGYAKEKTNDPVTIELTKLYKSTKDSNLVPKVAPYNFIYEGKQIKLEASEVTKWQRDMGQMNYTEIQRKMNSSEYRTAKDDTVRADMLQTIVNRNYNKVKEKYLKDKGLFKKSK